MGAGRPRPSGARVRDLAVGTDGMTGKIRDARGRNAEPFLAVAHFPQAARDTAIEALSQKASFAASLLAGRLPDDVDEALAATGYTLLPTHPDEIAHGCTCGEEPMPCRHVLALHELLADRLSHDPFLLFTLRGIDERTLLDELRKRRGIGPSAEGPARPRPPAAPRGTPLPDVPPERFFRPMAAVVGIGSAWTHGAPPDAVLAALGPPPLDDADAARLLAELHRAIGLGAKERMSEWEWRRS
jgi:uncharacterized Zn finger protein